MLARSTSLRSFLLCLCMALVLQVTTARNILHRPAKAQTQRQDDVALVEDFFYPAEAPTTTTTPSIIAVTRFARAPQEPAPTSSLSGEVTSTDGAKDSESTTEAGAFSTSTTPSRKNDASSTQTGTLAISTDGVLDNSTFTNVTIPAGQLPLMPVVTPGWGVAGAVLITTGILYTLVGFKNRWIHTFFSSAYFAALAIAVLIIYVMSVPVTNALQGVYVVAVIIAGCAMGTASVFFKELTEGLGCALGGFCLSMWLLCLAPGGLIHTVPAKAIFISCFTLAGFGFYFSRYTRDLALIGMISFAGATVVVLGIDCYSRAGLKEFWAYVWELNENLFPLGATTYPITKGIRVEIAIIIIITIMGIMSQIKLWKIVRERRQQRAAARAEGQRNLEQEEADLGRQIEEATARDKKEWERVYGDGNSNGEKEKDGDAQSDAGSENKQRESFGKSTKQNQKQQSQGKEEYEMADMSESSDRAEPLQKDEDGKVIVRVAADDIPEISPEEQEQEQQINTEGENGEMQRVRPMSAIPSVSMQVPRTPDVVPLPFRVPEEGADDDARSNDDRSSVATFADEDGQPDEPSHRRSLAKRLSQSSRELLRTLSPRSPRSPYIPGEPSNEPGESAEELVIPKVERADDESSMAATFDDESVHGNSQRSSFSRVEAAEGSPSIEITAVFSDRKEKEMSKNGPEDSSKLTAGEKEKTRATSGDKKLKTRPTSTDTVPTTVPETDATNKTASETANLTSPVTNRSCADEAEMSQQDQLDKAKSIASVISTPVSLTADRLPRPLSRVAMSYRTNEWAKHLSYADAPELDELHIEEVSRTKKRLSTNSTAAHGEVMEGANAVVTEERAVPVNVNELAQGVDDGTPGPALIKADSKVSVRSNNPSVGKKRSQKPTLVLPETANTMEAERRDAVSPSPAAGTGIGRSASAMGMVRTSSMFEPIAEEQDIAAAAEEEENAGSGQAPDSPRSVAHSIPGLVSYSSPQTLLGQREMFMRNKSQGNLMATLHPENNQYLLPENNYSLPDMGYMLSSPQSETGSLYKYPLYSTTATIEADNLPLSQRRDIIRSNSIQQQQRPNSTLGLVTTSFNSHQPQRNSAVPHPAVREAQLSNFRQSVAHDLTSGAAMISPQSRETPFATTTSLLMGGRDGDIRRNIELQRSVLLSQKETEQQKREAARREREWADRAFDERMRSGELMDAHREAMRKMQSNARER